MAKYFDEEWPKEEEMLRLGLEMSRKNKADRFPTADERWPRGGEVIDDKKPIKVINLNGSTDVDTRPSIATEYRVWKLFVDFPVSLSTAS